MVKPDWNKRVVWVNPGVIASSNWESYIQGVNQQLKMGNFVDTLKLPLSRHSTLTELQSLITLLSPKNVYPTTLVPSLNGLDWACLPGVFAESLSSNGYETLRRSTLDGLKQLFPDIDPTPEGMEKRMERVLSKSGHPDVEHENAFGSDEVEWTEARLQRVKKTKEHTEIYLPWLLGRRDTPTLAVAVNTFPAITSPTTTPAVDVNIPHGLCLTCANCPTCRPQPTYPSLRKASETGVKAIENSNSYIRSGSLSLPHTSSSNVHTTRSEILSPYYNEQVVVSPDSPELRHNGHPPPIALRTSSDVPAERPEKRLRSGPAKLRQNLPLNIEDLELKGPFSVLSDRIPTKSDSHASSLLSQSDSSNNMFEATLEMLAQLHTTLKNSETSLGPRLALIDSCRPHIVIPTRTAGGSLNRRLIQNTDHWRGNATTTSTNTSSSTATSQTPVTFAALDARERRRISKLKERDIRAQLAKLPPGFSKAFAETKSKSGSQ
ncbi:DNA repair protein, partial [Rhizoctonia solani]